MDVHAEKIELIKLLLETNNPSIIKRIKTILKSDSSNDFWDELSQHEKEEIENAEQEIERGEGKEFETFIAQHRK